MYGLMADAIARADADPAIQAVLFSGNGDCFSAGNDLGDFLANPPLTGDSPPERFLKSLSGARKVLVAAVHGAATGIGTTMLLHCDLVFAAHSASLSLPFVKLGLVPEAGSSLLLPRLIGHPRAVEMLLLGEPVDARTAHELGLVNRVVEDAVLLPTAQAVAEAVAALPPEAVLQTKALLKLNTSDLDERMEKELEVFGAQLRSPAFREIATAFLEKRKPDPAVWRR
jgi:enoyl-CoA hydratase/carnithine racemase